MTRKNVDSHSTTATHTTHHHGSSHREDGQRHFRRLASLQIPSPRYIGVFQESNFIAEAVHFIWKVIADVQQRCPYSKAVVGFSGGSTPRKIFSTLAVLTEAVSEGMEPSMSLERGALITAGTSERLSAMTEDIGQLDWNRVVIFLVDERYVPPDSVDSNQYMLRETLLQAGHIHIPEENIIFPDTTLPLMECVADYNKRLRLLFSLVGRPHLVTLGMGEDGHIASWFPPLADLSHDMSQSKDTVAYHTTQDRYAVRDRITVSMEIICEAAEKLLIMTGRQKVTKLASILSLDPAVHLLKEPVLQVVDSGSTTVLSYPPAITDSMTDLHDDSTSSHLSIIVFGASGDLARKKTFPALFSLFCEGLLFGNFHVIGFSRTKMSTDEFWKQISPYLLRLESYFKASSRYKMAILQDTSLGFYENFRKRVLYVSGNYDSAEAFQKLQDIVGSLECCCADYGSPTNLASAATVKCIGHRLFYLALPPTVFLASVTNAKNNCWSTTGWNRVVVEKPFGRDLKSASLLASEMMKVLREEETYRIDHYLGKEMVLNLMVLRFANVVIAPLMSWNHVAAVRITFKENHGTEGRGGYFDQFGIIRDIIQNHLLQILTIVAMERPASLKDDDIRDEKVKVLKQIGKIDPGDVVLGQYTRCVDPVTKNILHPGYTDDPTVPNDSNVSTFATVVLYINNDRWNKVPFILKAGKGLEERMAEIRIQFRPVAGSLFGPDVAQNELVIRVQPTEAVYMKVMTKSPGLAKGLKQTELDLTVMNRFDVDRLPDAYERLLLDVFRGDKQNFVRTDELMEAWKIFTPLLEAIEAGQLGEPHKYEFGSSGPPEAYELIKRVGYRRYEGYRWSSA